MDIYDDNVQDLLEFISKCEKCRERAERELPPEANREINRIMKEGIL